MYYFSPVLQKMFLNILTQQHFCVFLQMGIFEPQVISLGNTAGI